MALQVSIRGTLTELDRLWKWDILCLLIRVGYDNRSMVSQDERFTISEHDIERVFPESSRF